MTTRRLVMAAFPYVLVLVLGIFATVPFVDYEGRLILEPDFPIGEIRLYYDALREGSWATLPAPVPGVYFEGHSLLYGSAVHLYETVRGLWGEVPAFRQNAAVTVGLVDGLANIAAVLVFFATARCLSGGRAPAFLLTILFALSPQILAIDLQRIDRFMILPLVVVMHASVAITRGEAGWRLGALLGLAMAVLSATKISGFLFAIIPVSALLAVAVLPLSGSRGDRGRQRLAAGGRVFAAALAAGLPVLAVLMVRQLLHVSGFAGRLAEGYASQMKWTAVLPSTPLLYYNIDLFAGYGPAFLGLAALSILLVAVQGVRHRDPTCLWLLSNLLLFSALGAAAFKYERGGYHLVPLYLYALAIAAGWLERAVAARFSGRAGAVAPVRADLERAAGMAAVLLGLALPVGTVVAAYAGMAPQALQRPASITRTRFEPRDWIAQHFQPGSRICMLGGSEWAGPPLDGLALRVVTVPFDFPYLDTEAMGRFVPPLSYQLRASCDAVLFNDFHKAIYLRFLRLQGHGEVASEWERFYEALDRAYPPTVFAAAVPAYHVSRIEIHDLRGRPAAEYSADWGGALPVLEAGAEVRVDEALRVGSAVFRLAPGRFEGSVDRATRYTGGAGPGRDRVFLWGWAADREHGEPALGVLAVRGSRLLGLARTGTARRPDVAAHFRSPPLQTAGFEGCEEDLSAPAGPVDDGVIRFFALGRDGSAGAIAAPMVATPPAPGASEPELCRVVR